MTSVWLTPEVPAARTGAALAHTPRYSLAALRLLVGGFRGARDRDASYLHTHGSHDWLWSGDDEMRFHGETGLLCAVCFQIPWTLADRPELFERWLAVEPGTGGLRLPPGRNFPLPPTSSRWVAEGGAYLVCGNERNLAGTARLDRLRVAEGFDLLFADGLLAGWLLEGPERFLVNAWEFPADTARSPERALLLSDYLAVVGGPRIADMEDGDPLVLDDLASLEARAEALGCDVLRRAVRRHVTDWYS